MNELLSKLRAYRISSSRVRLSDPKEVRKAETTASSDIVPKTLCKVCKAIDIKDWLLDGQSWMQWAFLGYVDEIVKRSDCALCYLITKALEDSWTAMPVWVDLGLFHSGLGRTEVFLQPSEETTSEDLGRSINIHATYQGRLVREGDCRYAAGQEKFQAELRLLVDDAPTLRLESLGHARRISSVCDTALMALWYESCKTSHSESCTKARIVGEIACDTQKGEHAPGPKLPLGTRMIDVQKMKLVQVEETCEFVALSYVWGELDDDKLQTKRKNVKARQRRYGLRRVKFPKTIADAINLTKSLEIRFVWVDSLCIIQDGEDKEIQIQGMDRIYGLASLVIVAATGTDAKAGLTGYRDSPRTEINQHIGCVQGLQLAVSSPPLSHILKNSKWATRGWTFQEWHLAQRALIFTDQQVYYVCSSISCSEDIAFEMVPPHTPTSLTLKKCNVSTFRNYLPSRYSSLAVNSAWTEYQQLVEDYTPRELTHEPDTLPAISGIFNNLHRTSGNRFICGLSIGLFHDALFWVPLDGKDYRKRSETDKRMVYPTWSWAGWKGSAKYGTFPASDKPLIKEWRPCRYETAEKILVQIGTLGTPLSEPQDGRFVKSTNASDRPEASGEEQEIRRSGTGDMGANHLDHCFLSFQAALTTLQVAPVLNDTNGRAEGLLDLRGSYVGVALLNRQLTSMQRAMLGSGFQKYQCIAISLSESKLSYMDAPAFTKLPEDTEWVSILIVVEDEDVYYRVGVGQVSKVRWDRVKPEIREIVLG